MRCLILGGDGMLGHQLLRSWSRNHTVRVTLRRPLVDYAPFGLFSARNAYDLVDVRDCHCVRAVLEGYCPEVVVNATGIIKHRTGPDVTLSSLEVNAVFPHRLRVLCQEIGARLIHISTDCVFSGHRGEYTESDRIDAEDVYGLSKYLGEVSGPRTLTLRTSLIGLELWRKTGLVEWFLAQRGRVRGFSRAIFSGLTTIELARAIERLAVEHPDLSGVWHVASSPISKAELLRRLAAQLGRRDVQLVADASMSCDRSLSGEAFARRTGYQVPSWDWMLTELARQIHGQWLPSQVA